MLKYALKVAAHWLRPRLIMYKEDWGQLEQVPFRPTYAELDRAFGNVKQAVEANLRTFLSYSVLLIIDLVGSVISILTDPSSSLNTALGLVASVVILWGGSAGVNMITGTIRLRRIAARMQEMAQATPSHYRFSATNMTLASTRAFWLPPR